MTHPAQSEFELTLARPVVVPEGEHPALTHLWWRGEFAGDRLVQVYVDDELYDVTPNARQCQIWLALDRSRSHRIELLAVPASQAWVAQPLLLRGWNPRVADVAEVRVLRDESLAVATRVSVDVDGRTLEVSPLWPSHAHRGGFGALFGEGGFGFDAITGPGLGMGELGYGPLGADATAWHWRSNDLASGGHTLRLQGVDDTGQATSECVTKPLTIERVAEPARHLRIDADFTLHWQ